MRNFEMMKYMEPASTRYFTIEEYLDFEKTSLVKHEYLAGAIFERGRQKQHFSDVCTPRHSGIASNIVAALTPRLQKKQCRPFTSDLKVHIPENGLFTYPDVTIACGKREYFNDAALLNPLVIIEVLSVSTEDYDRGTKFRLYRSIPSLQEYIIISQTEQSVEIFRRNAHECWELYVFTGEADVELASVECTLTMAEIYADLDEI
jgi:Uma2 family endonuclease